ncbi:MAG: DUF6531 domain-containing protein, partial [Firmicutes bacterium]|nr:DUF6531 domain-containing protein [Bacillota bacterium]
MNALRNHSSRYFGTKRMWICSLVFMIIAVFQVFLPVKMVYAGEDFKIMTDSLVRSTKNFPEKIKYEDSQYSGILQKDGEPIARVVSGSFTPGKSKDIDRFSVNTGTSQPANSYMYAAGGYTGTLALVDVDHDTREVDYGHYDTKTETRIFTKTMDNTATIHFDQNGSVISESYSWNNSNNHPTYPINEDGYVGEIPKIFSAIVAGPVRTDHPDGTYTIVTTYSAFYEGELAKQVSVWVPNLVEVDDYTGYYSGTVYTADADTRVWEYVQNYTGGVYTHKIKKCNYGHPPNAEMVNEPVNIVTGNYYAIDVDLNLPDRGAPLEIVRHYNSLDKEEGMLGKGWHFNYDSSAETDAATGHVTVTYPDGREVVFEPVSGTNRYSGPETVFDVLTKKPDHTYILKRKDKLTYDYNSNGKLASITDLNGNEVTLRYDSSGHLTSIIGASGKTLTITTENGRIKTITDPLNRTMIYDYDVDGSLKQVKGIGGGTTNYAYNDHGITSITDENGKIFIKNEYDEFERIIRQWDEYGNIIEYTYDDRNMVNTYTFVSTGKSISYTYNEKLYITKKGFNDGTYEEYTYDEWGNRDSVKDRNGNMTRYTYDERGNVTAVVSPEPFNYTIRHQYDDADNLKEILTPGGGLTAFEYDTQGNLKKKSVKLDDTTYAVTTYTYDMYGRLTAVTDAKNDKITYEYKDSSMPTKITDAEGNSIEYGYDAIDRRTTIKTNYGTVTYEYNQQDKIKRIIDPKGSVTRMKYDSVGNLSELIKPEQYNAAADGGSGYTYAYDAMDRLTKQVDPLGNVIIFQYDEEGNRIKEVNPNYYDAAAEDGTGTGYVYDKDNRLIKITNPSGQQSRIKYDAAGNKIKIIDANHYDENTDDGAGMQYVYDNLNRLIKVKDTQDNVVQKLIYDADGRVIKEIDAKGYLSGQDDNSRYGTLYKYNLAGWLLEKREPMKKENGTVYYCITRYVYDQVGHLLQEKKSPEYVTQTGVPSGWNTITYTHDKNGRVKTISDTTGAYMEYTYDALGNTIEEKVKINEGTFSITGYSYDSTGRVDKQWKEIEADDLKDGGTGTVKAETKFAYDKNGNIVSIVRPEGYITTFEYDDAGRLIAKNEEVSEAHIDVNRTTAAIVSSKMRTYPGQQNEYKVQIQTDETVNALELEIEYDARLLELVNAVPGMSGVTVDTGTLGRIYIDGRNMNETNSIDLAGVTFKVKEDVCATGYITLNESSAFVNGAGERRYFTELIGKTIVPGIPDMNDDGKVETNDFTHTALRKGLDANSVQYEEKYDINGNGVIDIADLDYVKDWLFNNPRAGLTQLDMVKFVEKTTRATYEDS